MANCLFPTVDELSAVFVEEIQFKAGWLADSVVQDDCLVLRGLLPEVRRVRGTEFVCGGVAVRSCGDELYVQPYLQFREGGHGLIISHQREAKRLRRVDYLDDLARAESVVLGLRSAIHGCTQSGLLEAAVSRFQQAAQVQADCARVVACFQTVGERGPRISSQIVQRVASQFVIDEEPSIFGAIKAISSVAHKLAAPELRWALEEMCGDVLEALTLDSAASESSAAVKGFEGPRRV